MHKTLTLLLILASILLACQGFVVPEQDEQFTIMINNMLVVAISGGIDSSVSAALAVRASPYSRRRCCSAPRW